VTPAYRAEIRQRINQAARARERRARRVDTSLGFYQEQRPNPNPPIDPRRIARGLRELLSRAREEVGA
jgi:hypothetical protein